MLAGRLSTASRTQGWPAQPEDNSRTTGGHGRRTNRPADSSSSWLYTNGQTEKFGAVASIVAQIQAEHQGLVALPLHSDREKEFVNKTLQHDASQQGL